MIQPFSLVSLVSFVLFFFFFLSWDPFLGTVLAPFEPRRIICIWVWGVMAVADYFLRFTVGEHTHITGVVGFLFFFLFLLQEFCDTGLIRTVFCRQWNE